jgi:hypothetical protein
LPTSPEPENARVSSSEGGTIGKWVEAAVDASLLAADHNYFEEGLLDDVIASTAEAKSLNSIQLSRIPKLLLVHKNCEKPIRVLIDSGAQGNFIRQELCDRLGTQAMPLDAKLYIITADGSKSTIDSFVELMLYGKMERLYCAPLKNNLEIILGYPWMKANNVKFDYKTGEVVLCGEKQLKLPKRTELITGVNETAIMTKRELKRALKTKEVECVYQIELRMPGDEVATENCVQINTVTLDERVNEILAEYPEVFPREPKLTKRPEPRLKLSQPAMRIDTGNSKPISLPYYRMGPEDLKELKKQLSDLINSGLIKPSVSPWGAPCLFVKKKNGAKRLVIDYRQLNKVTKADNYPMPRIKDNLDKLGKGKYFTKLDATSGFLQNPVHPEDTEKTAFNTRYGSYEFLVTPFGLKNSPSAFQRMMNEILGKLMDECVVCYIDDLLIYSIDKESHIADIKRVSERLNEYGIQVNLQKSEFLRTSLVYCGFKIENGQTTVDPDKLEVVRSWPTPTDVTQIRSFLGFVGFYRSYIKNFANLAEPLTNLTKKGVIFKWSENAQIAFEELKKAMLSSPVLRNPDDTIPFHIWPDASPFAIGGVLTQEFEDGHHPIAYFQRRLSSTEENYSQYEKELYALIGCLRKWRFYFEGREFYVHSDNQSVVQVLKSKRDPHKRIARLLDELSMWSPDIRYVRSEQQMADAISRVDNVLEVHPLQITSSLVEGNVDLDSDWPTIIFIYLKCNSWPNGLPEQVLSKCRRELNNFGIQNEELVRYKKEGRAKPSTYVRPSQRQQIMDRFHSGLGHLGYDSTYPLLSKRYWWPSMTLDYQRFIQVCNQCQLDRSSNRIHNQRPIQPLPSVAFPFERWGIDFIQNLPETSKGNKHIISAIDYGTRWVVLKAVKRMDTNTVIEFLYSNILVNYGAPYEIITDRGSSILADAVSEYEKIQKIKHKASSAYHPQTNGMVERMHAMVGHSITTLTEGRPRRWDEFLDQTVFSLRVRTHSVTGFSPFYLLYGVEPRLPGDLKPPRSLMEPLSELERREERNEFIARTMDELGWSRGQAYQKSVNQELNMRKRISNEDYQDHYFTVNDMVKLKHHGKTKFEFEWKGPFFIVELGSPGVYYLMKPNGQRLDSPTNEADLAPWLASTERNVDYFYDGSPRDRNATE